MVMIEKKTILIAGYYGFENTGDEAILSSILTDMRNRRQNLEFLVVSGNPEATRKQHKVRSILWTDISAIMDACQQSDLILLGGGGLFHDYWGTTEENVLTQSHSGISFYSDFPILAALYKKPCILYSIGVGPLLTEAGKNLTRVSFENADIATVRDIESLNLLQELEIATNNIKITADPAFNLHSDRKRASEILKGVQRKGSPLVAVSLRNWAVENSTEAWKREIADALDLFSEKYNATFIFIPLQSSSLSPLTDDLVIAKNITGMMKNSDQAIILQDVMDPETISGVIAHTDLVVGMRLHALIFSVNESIPAVGLVYDPKVENLMRMVGMQEFSISMELLNSQHLFELMDRVWGNKERISALIAQEAGKLKSRANENSKLAIQLLEDVTLSAQKKTDANYIHGLLLKQTRKLAEVEKVAHTLWQQMENNKQQSISPAPASTLSQPVQEKNSQIRALLPSGNSVPYRPDIICFSIIEWDFRYQRPQQIMSQFAAQGHRVFYISTSRFQPMGSSPAVQVRIIKENIYEIRLSAHHVPDLYGEDISSKNFEAMLASLEELRHVYQIKEAIGYVMIASWGGIALETRDRWDWQVIYDCMDEWDNFPLVKAPIVEAELRLVHNCDLLVVTSQRLFDKWRDKNRPMLLARNAADYEFYEQHYLPNNLLSDVKHPIVGYYGAIADWFDLELMIHVAENRPEYTFVLLGGIFDLDVSRLSSLPNVLLLGQQPYDTMPQYLYHFDVCIIPFKINAITEATDPVKIYEYMCGGKPVVSVALPELESYKELLYLADNQSDFISKLDQALHENNNDLIISRKIFARQNTWGKRVLSIDDAINSIVRNRVNFDTPLPLILPRELLISSTRIARQNNVDYWCLIYEEGTTVHKQISLDIAEREYQFLLKLKSDYFPEPLGCKVEESYSIVVLKKVEGESLIEAITKINSSVVEMYGFIVHCLNILDSLSEHGLLHRNICRDNIMIENGKPILFDFGWAVSEDKPLFAPFGLGGSERPKDGSFSDVYSMGKILEYVSQKRYPAFDWVISLMTAQDSLMRITDLKTLKTLFNMARRMMNKEKEFNDEVIDIEAVQQSSRNLLEQTSNRSRKLDGYIRQKNYQDEKISSLENALHDLKTQLAASTIHAEGLTSLVSQKDQEIQGILNSNTWKLALRLQRIRRLFKK